MDDDTIFFPDAVIRLLEDFDPDMPYFISGAGFASDSSDGRASHTCKEGKG
jgi:hypothetical protein